MALCSIALAAGVIGVVALVKGLFFRRRFRGGGSCGGGHHRGWGRRGWSRGPGGSFWLRTIFARLDTTPGQEREIRFAIEELQRIAREAKDGLRGAREDLAKAVGGESFDDGALGEAASRADATTARIKEAFTDALRKVHAVLDARQRERLAELLAKGPGFGRGRWGGPYRDAAI